MPNRRRTSWGCASGSRPSIAIRPPSGREQRRQHLDGGGLAGAVGSEEGEDLPGLDVEGHAVDGFDLAEGLGQVLDVDHEDLSEKFGY